MHFTEQASKRIENDQPRWVGHYDIIVCVEKVDSNRVKHLKYNFSNNLIHILIQSYRICACTEINYHVDTEAQTSIVDSVVHLWGEQLPQGSVEEYVVRPALPVDDTRTKQGMMVELSHSCSTFKHTI